MVGGGRADGEHGGGYPRCHEAKSAELIARTRVKGCWVQPARALKSEGVRRFGGGERGDGFHGEGAKGLPGRNEGRLASMAEAV